MREAWTDEQIKSGLKRSQSEGPETALVVHAISLFQRAVIALETIAEAHKPQTLMQTRSDKDLKL